MTNQDSNSIVQFWIDVQRNATTPKEKKQANMTMLAVKKALQIEAALIEALPNNITQQLSITNEDNVVVARLADIMTMVAEVCRETGTIYVADVPRSTIPNIVVFADGNAASSAGKHMANLLKGGE